MKESTVFSMYEGIKSVSILQYCKQYDISKTYDFFVCKYRLSEATFYRSPLCKVLFPTQLCTNCLNNINNINILFNNEYTANF